MRSKTVEFYSRGSPEGYPTIDKYMFNLKQLLLTTPFGYAVTERSRSAGTAQQQGFLCLLGFAIGRPNLQSIAHEVHYIPAYESV